MKVDVVDPHKAVVREWLSTLVVAGFNLPRDLAIAEVNHA